MSQVTVTVKQKTKTFTANDGDNLLATCLHNKVRVDHICQKGLCGACQVMIEEGSENITSPTIMEKLLLDTEPLNRGVRLACQAKVLSGPVQLSQPKLKD